MKSIIDEAKKVLSGIVQEERVSSLEVLVKAAKTASAAAKKNPTVEMHVKAEEANRKARYAIQDHFGVGNDRGEYEDVWSACYNAENFHRKESEKLRKAAGAKPPTPLPSGTQVKKFHWS